jgi:DNA-binding transcriptional LysR family regulator
MGWLTPRLGDCFRRHPGLALRVVSLFTVPRDLPAEGLDAWIGYQPEPPAGEHVEPLLDEWLLPVAAPSWLASPRRTVQPADLLHDDQPWPGAHASDEWGCWLAAVATGLRHEPAALARRLSAGGGAVARLPAEALAPLLGLFAGPAGRADRADGDNRADRANKAPATGVEPPPRAGAGPALAPPEAWAAALAGGRRFNLVQLSVAAAQAGQGVALARWSLVADELAEGRLLAPWGVAVLSPARYWLVASSAAAASPALGLLRDWLREALAAEAQARRQRLLQHGLVLVDGAGVPAGDAAHRR